MEAIIQKLTDLIERKGFQGEDRELADEILKALKKEKGKNDFKLNRFINDKTIAVNLLNATIEDLEKKKQLIEESNKKLLDHQQQIEHKNIVLESQKNRIEEQRLRLEENLEMLTTSYSELEQFTYIASHDLKSPLRTISNFGQLLKRRLGKDLNQECKEFLDFMVSGAQQMNTVICDLLEFAHVGNKNKVESLFDLIEVIDVVKFNLATPIEENKAEIIFDELPQLYGLKSSIIQLFQNLIGNAIKFRKENETPIVKIIVEDQGDSFYFEVQDNGVGMEEVYQNKAFMPFQRINNLERPGSGIGLAICKKVVTQHGGKIWFRSKEGEGSTFCFTLNKNNFEDKHKKQEAVLNVE